MADVHHDFVDGVLAGEAHGRCIFPDLAGKKNGGGDEEPSGGFFANEVASELFADEAVVGLVVIERLNDVVAVGPCVWTFGVHLEAVGIGVTNHVEPVLRPAFSVTRGGEQGVDNLLLGAGRGVLLELSDFGGSGREAG